MIDTRHRTARGIGAMAVAAGLLLGAAPSATAQSQRGAEQREIALVRGVYQHVFTQHRLDLAGRYLRQDYIQHTPTVPQGLAGFKQFYGGYFFKLFPDVTATIDIISAQNDMVTSMATWRAHQAGNGKELVLHTADLYRIQGGKLAEHWDVIDYSGLAPFGIDPPRGDEPSTPVDWAGSPQEIFNLLFTERFIDDIFRHRNLDRAGLYVSEDIAQHDPNIQSGLDGFKACLQKHFSAFPDLTFTISHIVSSPHRVTVFWTWRGHAAQTGQSVKLTSADSYRIQHGKVVDHWDVGDMQFPAS